LPQNTVLINKNFTLSNTSLYLYMFQGESAITGTMAENVWQMLW